MEHNLYKDEIPFVSTFEYHKNRERAPHLEQKHHRGRLLKVIDIILTLKNCKSLVDLGCGDGGLLSMIQHNFEKVLGYDFCKANIEAAKNIRKVDAQYENFIDKFDELPLNVDVIVMTEVLEHLAEPHMILRKCKELNELKYLVLSSPVNETIKHHDVSHAWVWDAEGYKDMIKNTGWKILESCISGSFQIYLCIK